VATLEKDPFAIYDCILEAYSSGFLENVIFDKYRHIFEAYSPEKNAKDIAIMNKSLIK